MKRMTLCGASMLLLAVAAQVWAAGTVEEVTYYSNAMGKDMVAFVHLPEDYDSSGIDYPVIYWIGGYGDGYGNWADGLQTELDALIGEGLVEPFIWVEIDQLVMPWPSVPVQQPSFLTDSELNGPYETAIIEDLIPWVDATYRTLANRDHRLIFGGSAGGYSATRAALRHWGLFGGLGTRVGTIAMEPQMAAVPMLLAEYPDGPPYEFNPTAGTWSSYLFAWCAAMTPNMSNPPWNVDMWVDENGDIDPVVLARYMSNSNSRWAAEMLAAGGMVDIFMDAGDQDFYLPFTTYFADDLDTLGIPYTLQMFHGDHDNPGWWERIKSHITYFFPLNATLELSPRVLNGRHWWPLVEATIELPGDLDVTDIDTSTLAITQVNGEDLDTPMQPLLATDISDVNGNGRDDLTVWFWKPTVLHVLDGLGISNGEAFDLTIEGETTDLLFLAATDEARAVNLKADRTMPMWPMVPIAVAD